MAPPKEPEPALAAPGLTGAMSIETPPMGGPRSNRRSRNRPYAHVTVEMEIDPARKDTERSPVRERRVGSASRSETSDAASLLVQAAELLHAVAAHQFRRVESWTLHPSSVTIPDDRRGASDASVPLGALVKAIEAVARDPTKRARSFDAVVSDRAGQRVGLRLRHATLSKRTVLNLDLSGTWTKLSVHSLEGAISDRLPVVRSEWKKYRYAD